MIKSDEKITMEAFLGTIFKGCQGYMEMRAIKSDGSIIRDFFPVGNYNGPVKQKFLELNKQGFNIYYGVCPRETKDGHKMSVKEVPCLWLDIDAKDFNGDKEKTFAQFDLLPTKLMPSVIVDSGNGFHAYWLFDKPEKTPHTIARTAIESIISKLIDIVGGDRATKDVTRILRVPGTKNVKTKTEQKDCKIILWSPERVFKLSDFEKIPDGYMGGNKGQMTLPDSVYRAEKGEWDDVKLNRKEKWIEKALRGVDEGKRNQTCARLAGYYINIMPLGLARAHLREWGIRCRPPMDWAEIDRTIESIQAKVTREATEAPEIQKMTWVKTEPSYFIVHTTDGQQFKADPKELRSKTLFMDVYSNALGVFPDWKVKNWIEYINKFLANADIEEDTAGESSESLYLIDMIRDHFSAPIQFENPAVTREEFYRGRIIPNGDSAFYVSVKAIRAFLDKKCYKINQQELFKVLKDAGIVSKKVTIKGQETRGRLFVIE